MRKILITLMTLVTLANAGFTKSGNIVTDSTTGLQWQDDIIGTTTTWQEAIDRCENLSLDSYTDWRLPNLNELTSLVDDTTFNPSISSIFANIVHSYDDAYWSSTTSANGSDNAWHIHFYDGHQGYTFDAYKKNNLYVRCVRAGE